MDLNHNSQRLLLCAGSMTAACFNLEEDQVGPQQSDIRMPKVIGDSRAGQGSKLHRYILPHSGAMPLSCIIYRSYIYISYSCMQHVLKGCIRSPCLNGPRTTSSNEVLEVVQHQTWAWLPWGLITDVVHIYIYIYFFLNRGNVVE